MKTGCCLLLLATPDDPLARRAVPLAGQSGYDYAEVSLAGNRRLPQTAR